MAVKYLRGDCSLANDEDISELKKLTNWFNVNLEKPTRFFNGTSKYNADISLSWFKDSAKKHIQKIYYFITIAKKYDIVIEKVTSKNPGYIIFEDEYQVSAVPFKTDRNRVK